MCAWAWEQPQTKPVTRIINGVQMHVLPLVILYRSSSFHFSLCYIILSPLRELLVTRQAMVIVNIST